MPHSLARRLTLLPLLVAAACSGPGGPKPSDTPPPPANTAPLAAFTAVMDPLGVVTVDATASADAETGASALELCWDWDGDGTCDVPWTTARLGSHAYAPGAHTIRLRVRDGGGLEAEATRAVTAPTVATVDAGAVGTATWSGTIVVTGDVTVAAGSTLTVAAGTTVLFAHADADANGVGDVGLAVEGVLQVEGTAQAPVRFAGHPAGGGGPGSWDRLLLAWGAPPSMLRHLVVEGADVGIEVANPSALEHVTVRAAARFGLVLADGAGGASLTGVVAEGCGQSGLRAAHGGTAVRAGWLVSRGNGDAGLEVLPAAALDVSDATFAENATDGVRSDGLLSLDHVLAGANRRAGLWLQGGTAAVTNAEISANADAGVVVRGEPAVVIQRSNVRGNGLEGTTSGNLVDPSAVLSLTTAAGGRAYGEVWTAPAGTTVDRVRLSYWDWTAAQILTGVLVPPASETTLAAMAEPGTAWRALPEGTSALRVGTWDSGFGTRGPKAILVSSALVRRVDPALHHDLSALTESARTDARSNFWTAAGADVPSRIRQVRPSTVDFSGFVLTPWPDAGPRRGGGGQGTNTAPTATFTAAVDELGRVTVDATASADPETAATGLEVCWDWDDDGLCETPWAAARVARHGYAPGTHTVRLKIRDPDGNEAVATRTVTAPSLTVVGAGPVSTSTWSGTVVVTGDVTVPAGETLTVAAGATVFFVHDDANFDGIADYGLTVEGVLNVEGTAPAPVRLAGHPDADRVAGAWNRVLLAAGAAPSSLSHLIVEGAEVGIEVQNPSALADVEVSGCVGWGVLLSGGASGASLTRVTAEGNGSSGVHVAEGGAGVTMTRLVARRNVDAGLEVAAAASTTVADSSFEANGTDGVRSDGQATLEHVLAAANGRAGLWIQGGSATVGHAELSGNGDAGVVVRGEAAAVVQQSNVRGNGVDATTVGALADPSGVLSFSTTSGGRTYGASWFAPAWTTVERVELEYSEWTTAQVITGVVVRPGSEVVLAAILGAGTAWCPLPEGEAGLRVGFWDSATSLGLKSIVARSAALRTRDPARHHDLSVLTEAASTDARANFWTATPEDVPGRIHALRTSTVDASGAVLTPYADAGPRP